MPGPWPGLELQGEGTTPSWPPTFPAGSPQGAGLRWAAWCVGWPRASPVQNTCNRNTWHVSPTHHPSLPPPYPSSLLRMLGQVQGTPRSQGYLPLSTCFLFCSDPPFNRRGIYSGRDAQQILSTNCRTVAHYNPARVDVCYPPQNPTRLSSSILHATHPQRDTCLRTPHPRGDDCPARAWRATFVLTIPTATSNLPPRVAPQVDQSGPQTFPEKHVA